MSDSQATEERADAGHPVERGAPLLTLRGVSRVFDMGEVRVEALKDADLTIAPGEFITVLGPSGSGKSTLLNVLGGTDRPTHGEAWYTPPRSAANVAPKNGRLKNQAGARMNLATMTDAQLTDYRREAVGFVFQFYNLVPTLTALENVQVAAELMANPMPPREALEMVGLTERANHFPAQLSGGEQQRVSIARALVKRPHLLLADEPTGALDLPTARVVLGILQRLNREQGLTVVLITHNPAIAELTDRVIRIVSGRITEDRINSDPIEAAEVSW